MKDILCKRKTKKNRLAIGFLLCLPELVYSYQRQPHQRKLLRLSAYLRP